MLAQLGQLISPGKGLSEEEGGANGDSLKEQLRSLCSRRGSRVSESQRVTTGQAVCALLRRCQGGRWRRPRRRSVEKAEEEVSGEGPSCSRPQFPSSAQEIKVTEVAVWGMERVCSLRLSLCNAENF